MDYKSFLNTHPVFTLDELTVGLGKEKTATVYNNLKYYVKRNKIRSVKRGLYYVVPDESSPENFCPDAILVTSRLSKDAVVAFHSALELMGYGHSIFHRFFYYTALRKRVVLFKGEEFISVKVQEMLKQEQLEMTGVEEMRYHNTVVRSTNRERTFLDCLDRPEYGGGIEEVYRCVEKYPYLDFEEIMNYLEALGKKMLYAKAGFFLKQHREQFYVEESLLQKLRKRIPNSVIYFDSQRKKGKLIKEWNLVIPDIIRERAWEEF